MTSLEAMAELEAWQAQRAARKEDAMKSRETLEGCLSLARELLAGTGAAEADIVALSADFQCEDAIEAIEARTSGAPSAPSAPSAPKFEPIDMAALARRIAGVKP